MPSTAPPADKAQLHRHPALRQEDTHRLVVLTAGFIGKSSLEFHHFIRWFRQVADVLVVDHPEAGFSLTTEAGQVIPYIQRADEVYFVGLSLGARLATEVLDQLEGSALRGRVKGVLPICGINQPSDFNGPSPRLWRFLVWPLTAPWFNRRQAIGGDKKKPGPQWEVPLMTHHQRAIEYGFKFPARGRRAQVRGISLLRPLVPGAYVDVPMVYLATKGDQVLHPEPAAVGWLLGFGESGRAEWIEGVRHCSLNEHPFAWASPIGKVFTGWGVPLGLDTFYVPMRRAHRQF